MEPGGTRDRSIGDVERLLAKAGFYVTDAHHIRPTSFDLMARRDSHLLIVKVLKNIDALDPLEAERLGDLTRLFRASVLVVGETSGASKLEAGVVYNRYGLPIISSESLEDYLLHGVPPFLFSSPGGIFARVDGGLLKRLREERGLSLGSLASVAGVSRRTIQLYEEGAGAEMEILERLERFLAEPLARALELFALPQLERNEGGNAPSLAAAHEGTGRALSSREPKPTSHKPATTGDPLRDNVFLHLDGMGWEVVITLRCPFDAFTHGDRRGEEEILLTSVGSLRSAAHRAEVLHGLARVAEGHAMFVVRDAPPRTSIDGLPIVGMPELRRHRDRAELIDLLQERGGP